MCPVKNGPEDDYLLVETCIPHITLCNNKYSPAYVQFFSITIQNLCSRNTNWYGKNYATVGSNWNENTEKNYK